MRTICVGATLLLAAAVPALAGPDGLRLSTGYSAALDVEEYVANAAWSGVYLSAASGRRGSLEADISCMWRTMESGWAPGWPTTFTQRILTAGLGPRWETQIERRRPFFHVLLGVRGYEIEGVFAMLAPAVTVGGGVDFLFWHGAALRLGADAQIALQERFDPVSGRLLCGIGCSTVKKSRPARPAAR
jgi:hypothetical protein